MWRRLGSPIVAEPPHDGDEMPTRPLLRQLLIMYDPNNDRIHAEHDLDADADDVGAGANGALVGA